MQLTVMQLRPNFRGKVLIVRGTDFPHALSRAAQELYPTLGDNQREWNELFMAPIKYGPPVTTKLHDSDREITLTIG